MFYEHNRSDVTNAFISNSKTRLNHNIQGAKYQENVHLRGCRTESSLWGVLFTRSANL